MEYGSHVDDALMQGVRTDVSFTLFLSDPDGYEGGACDRDLGRGGRCQAPGRRARTGWGAGDWGLGTGGWDGLGEAVGSRE